MKTIKVSESDFEEYKYLLKVTCPYCGRFNFFFFEYQKWIDETDYCPECGKEVRVVSKESE